jgi:hypothetical protein
MKSAHRVAAALALTSFVGIVPSLAQGQPVVSPQARQASLATAEKLLSARPAGLPADYVDPFHSAAFAAAAGAVGGEVASAQDSGTAAPSQTPRTGPRTDRELLAAIAANLKPSGYFVLSGQPVLTFGQKRVKAGTPLTITFEGVEYTLEITAITRTNFTLRLNREEFTRPIK